MTVKRKCGAKSGSVQSRSVGVGYYVCTRVKGHKGGHNWGSGTGAKVHKR